MKKIKIGVGSTNSSKIKAVQIAASAVFGSDNFEIIACAAKSHVSEQPRGEEETYAGASNRAADVLTHHPLVDVAIGMESGVTTYFGTKKAMSYVAAIFPGPEKVKFFEKGSTHSLTPEIETLVDTGMEVSEAIEHLHGIVDIKNTSCCVSFFTGGALNRADYFATPLKGLFAEVKKHFEALKREV